MGAVTIHSILSKWLKKAKLRNGSHEVGLIIDYFYYRGHTIGAVDDDGVGLTWPATVEKDNTNPWKPSEFLSIADPKFFIKLRKAFHNAMVRIDAVSINVQKSLSTGTRRTTTKR